MNIKLKQLYDAQRELDDTIHHQHNLNYEVTRNRRILSLIVEIGELANETRCFKYWSNKKPSEKSVILDEFADGMHFFLSLGIDLKVEPNYLKTTTKNQLDLTEQFLLVYENVIKLKKNYQKSNYIRAFRSFLTILDFLNYDEEDITKAYYQKLSVNYQRQDNNY